MRIACEHCKIWSELHTVMKIDELRCTRCKGVLTEVDDAWIKGHFAELKPPVTRPLAEVKQ